MEISLTVYVLCLIVMALEVLDASSNSNLAIFMIAVLLLALVVCIGWVIYLTVSDLIEKGCCPPSKNSP